MKKTAFLPQIIEIVGNVGSGKTTLSKKLAKKMSAKYIDVDPYINNPFLPSYVMDMKRWAFSTALHFSFMRSKMIVEVKKITNIPIVLDHGFESGLHMYPWVSFKNGEMNKDEWNFLQQLHNEFMDDLPMVSTTVFIHITTEEIMKRLKIRGREHEKYYTTKYVESLQKGLNEYRKKLIKNNTRQTLIDFYPKSKITKTTGVKSPEVELFLLR